jgi:hypothetical protein
MSAPTKSAGFTQIPHGFHERIAELSGAQLKVWLAHRCREGKDGDSYPSLTRLTQDTGLDIHTVTDARRMLRETGWLESTGQTRASHGQFSIPYQHTVVPPPVSGKPTNGAGTGTAGGKSTNRLGTKPTNGAGTKSTNRPSTKTASGKGTTEVDPSLEVDPIQVDPVEVNPTEVKEREKEPFPTAGTKTNLSPSLNKSGKAPQTAASKNPGVSVADVLLVTKRFHSRASFSKTAQKELRAALDEIGDATIDEVRAVVEKELKACRDDDPASFVLFGSTLAANLVASVRVMRERKAKADGEHAADQWLRDYELFCKTRDFYGEHEEENETAMMDWFDTHPQPSSVKDLEEVHSKVEAYWEARRKPKVADTKVPSEPTWTPEELKIAAALRSGEGTRS